MTATHETMNGTLYPFRLSGDLQSDCNSWPLSAFSKQRISDRPLHSILDHEILPDRSHYTMIDPKQPGVHENLTQRVLHIISGYPRISGSKQLWVVVCYFIG